MGHKFPIATHTKPVYTLAQAAQTASVLPSSTFDQDEGSSVGNTYLCTMWTAALLIHPVYPVAVVTWGTHKPPRPPATLPLQAHRHTEAVDSSSNQPWAPSPPSSWPWVLTSPFAQTYTHVQTGLTVDPRPHSHPCHWPRTPGPASGQLLQLSHRAGTHMHLAQAYLHFDTWLPSHLSHLPASKGGDLPTLTSR